LKEPCKIWIGRLVGQLILGSDHASSLHLADDIQRWWSFLDQIPGFLDKLASAPTINPAQGEPVTTADLDQIIEDPPAKTVAPGTTSKSWLSRKARKIDFAERDAASRHLARIGEQFVFDLERSSTESRRSGRFSAPAQEQPHRFAARLCVPTLQGRPVDPVVSRWEGIDSPQQRLPFPEGQQAGMSLQ